MNSEFICGQTPILDLAAGVRAHLAAKGYKERNLIRLQKIWNHFARYADNCHFTIELGAAFLRDAYDIEWAEFPPPMKRHQRRSVSAIRYLRDYELNGEISLHRPMKQPYIWPSQFSDAAQSFLEYMDENGYSRDYIRGTTREVHKFLEYLSDHGVQGCETITISNVMDFIRDQYSHFAVSTLKTTVGKLRTFLKFLYLDELTDCDLASMIPSVRNFRLAQLPVVWNPEDLHLLLTAINRETSNGKRDYAIFMLAIYLGLRIGDTFNVTPHVFRHTKAMHLLNADVNMFYIRDILGHVDISTTEIYARIDAEKKRTILEKISCNSVSNRLPSWQEDRSLMMWLKSLAK